MVVLDVVPKDDACLTSGDFVGYFLCKVFDSIRLDG